MCSSDLIENRTGKVCDEDNGIRPVLPVIAPDPELLPRPAVKSNDHKAAFVIRALTRHAEQDPPAASGTKSPGRATIERRHSGEQLEAPLFGALPIEDDATRASVLIGHCRYDFVFAIAVHVADERPGARWINQQFGRLVRPFEEDALFRPD